MKVVSPPVNREDVNEVSEKRFCRSAEEVENVKKNVANPFEIPC